MSQKNFLFIFFIFTSIIKILKCQNCPPLNDSVGYLPQWTGLALQPCSYAGFAPIQDNGESALFYWYFPAANTTEVKSSRPVIVWLDSESGIFALHYI